MSAVLTPTMTSTASTTSAWTDICPADDILPDTGVCALVQGRHVAVFRVKSTDQGDRFFAIDNVDPKSGASVLARGLVGSLGERIVVASPLYKQHIDLQSGECIEQPELSVSAHAVRTEGGLVQVSLR